MYDVYISRAIAKQHLDFIMRSQILVDLDTVWWPRRLKRAAPRIEIPPQRESVTHWTRRRQAREKFLLTPLYIILEIWNLYRS